MKRLFSFVCVAMLAAAASAQITWNAKGGVGVATSYGDDIDGKKPHFVGKAGAGFEYPLGSNWSLMPSLEIAWKGLKNEIVEENWKSKATVDLLYAQVPVVAAYRINVSDAWNITLKAGPYFALALYDNLKVEQTSNGTSSSDNQSLECKIFDTGLDLGIDFERHKFVFGVEAEIGFIDLVDYMKAKNFAFYATVGWKF